MERKKTTAEEVLSKFVEKDGCHVFSGAKDRDGYGLCTIAGRSRRVHRLAWEAHSSSDIPKGKIVMHSCDNPPCINPKHLSVGTYQDNAVDCARKGRNAKHHKGAPGVKNGSAKLTEDDVRKIRWLNCLGYSQTAIGRIFKITQAAARYVIIGKTWKHVK